MTEHSKISPIIFFNPLAEQSVFNPLPHNPDFLTTLKKTPFENIVGKWENAGNQHFLIFPQCFNPSQKELLLLSCICFVAFNCFQFGPV